MKWLKVGAVIFGALIITALGIDAADTLSGSRSTLLGQLISFESSGLCPKGMIEVGMSETFTCVDMFEASASSECPHPSPINELETKENIDSQACKAESTSNVDAWRFITREQAQSSCIKAGKRLPKSNEWYLVSVGTPDDASKCNINTQDVAQTGAYPQCVSSVGVFDSIGNAWEWTSDDVFDGNFEGRALPASGYVAQVDSNGIATLTNPNPSGLFYKDYFWSAKSGAFGILRGGFFGSQSDAGVYTVHAETVPTAAGTAIGFRCVK